MTILIEGPDNVGKSSQIRAIKNHFNKETFATCSLGSVKQNSPEEYIQCSKDYFKNLVELSNYQYSIGKSSIWDRSHLGEMVYAPMYRNYSGDFALEYEKHVIDPDTFLFVFIDEAQNLIDRDDGLSHSVELDKKEKEIKLFEEAYEKSTIKNKTIIYINGLNEKEVTERVIRYLNVKIKNKGQKCIK